ncbi:PREDICTED: LRR receptor-like serine/threonine-protein kinase RPK2 [Theobroma cacao]|uniref:non-specific serine/threonine protein kinase n=1 Tax=Theobroma cacao TaxID=3641 RepID=A0AB32VQ92_THECC|nr:PREDICTED: LRR receptor-like serine/threonine-protein kinase RPK2 [Theobroma cacao]
MRKMPPQLQKHALSLNTLLFSILVRLFMFKAVSLAAAFKDKDGLLHFKSAIVEDPLGFTSSWNPNDKDPCLWRGVTCDPLSGRVISLNLSSNLNSTCSLLSLSTSTAVTAGQVGGNFSLLYPCLHVGADDKISFAKLRGKLSPSIGYLTKLRVLSLGFNAFFGELPLDIGKLNLLEILDLGFNAFHGPIPATLKNCTALRVINLSGNQLNGTIPAIFRQFVSLQVVDVSLNGLSGEIPEELGENCGSLVHLHLASNGLSGSIPSKLGNCGELKSLILSSNMLQDDIPSSLGKLENLEALDLSRNFLSGVVPPDLGNCKQLKLLVLKNNYGPLFSRKDSSLTFQQEEDGEVDYNYFEGELPESIVELPNIHVLWVPNANLEGSFPQTWGSCSNLNMLNVAQNFLTGQIPVSFGNCKSLHFLDLSSNNLTGLLPTEISVPCMVVFNVSENSLVGNISRFSSGECSNSSGNLSVSQVDLVGFYSSFFYRNTLVNVGPFSFSSSEFVVLHDLSKNQFTGSVPPFFISSYSLSVKPHYGFWLNGNNFEGNLSAYSFDPCLSLDGLIFDISNNKIVDQLPSDIGSNCKCMKFLSVASNEFVGSIPTSFTNMVSLVKLNLSENRLQGPIPSYIGEMNDLRYLSLSSNNFTGAIPQDFIKLYSVEVLELSSNSLSGEIPPDLAKLKHLSILRLDHNKLTGQIPSGFSNITTLSVFSVSFNNLSGSIPLNSNSINCESVKGNPNLQPCRPDQSSSELERQHFGNISQQGAYSPMKSIQKNGSGFSSLEIASITSASIIFAVLIALIFLLVCMKKFACNSVSDQVSGSKEVVTCNSIGVQLTYENVVRATGCFNLQNCIGSGGFGATYKAEITPGVVVSVKRLSVGRFQGVQQFSAEIKTLGRVQHPNLVTLIGYHVSEAEMFLIYNYLPGGNLEKFIQERSSRTVEWSMLHKIALDIARALTYLHDECVPRVLHRDIKPSNILLDNNFNAYLSDFGLARLLGTSETHATTDVAGTFGYVAPEYALTCRVSDKADVYSYGVVLLELLSDKKALDPSFSSFGNGFNIVTWASMLLGQGRGCEFFTAGLWDSGPQDDLIEVLHLAVKCTGEYLSSRPSMRQVAQRLKGIQPATA